MGAQTRPKCSKPLNMISNIVHAMGARTWPNCNKPLNIIEILFQFVLSHGGTDLAKML